MNYTSSIYIPRMFAKHDLADVKRIMSIFRIGVVSRVDFIPINKKPGFIEEVDSYVKSAFVHFHDTTPKYPESPVFEYNETFWEFIDIGKSPQIQVSENEYWICSKNNKPVQNTFMNIHQVVENCRHLEKLVQEQAKTIEQQEKTIEQLSEKIDGVHDVVYQLLGGLFNQGTQKGILRDHFSNLSFNSVDLKGENTSKWTMWPTTRQGDDCEQRIAALEDDCQQRIAALEKIMSVVDQEQQDSELLLRKHNNCKSCDDDDSCEQERLIERQIELYNNLWAHDHDEDELTIVSSDDDESRMVEEQLELERRARKEDRYNEMQVESVDELVADMHNRWC